MVVLQLLVRGMLVDMVFTLLGLTREVEEVVAPGVLVRMNPEHHQQAIRKEQEMALLV